MYDQAAIRIEDIGMLVFADADLRRELVGIENVGASAEAKNLRRATDDAFLIDPTADVSEIWRSDRSPVRHA
jgi:hypothetical protein